MFVEEVKKCLVCLKSIHKLVPGKRRKILNNFICIARFKTAPHLHVVSLLGRVELVVMGISVRVLVCLRQVHDEGPGVEDLPGHGHRVQPVRGVEAVVGGHRGSHVRHVHRVVVIIVEYLKLVRVGVAIKLKDQGH